MSYQFSKSSRERLSTCHPDLQRLFNEVIEHFDCAVLCGHRTQAAQDEAVRTGRSQESWPHSKHNTYPSLAVDVVPSPVDWNDERRFYMFVGVVRGIASQLNIPIRCGADWDGDLSVKDQNFHDLPHFELSEVVHGDVAP